MPDIFDQIHAEAPKGGDLFDQIHSEAQPSYSFGGFVNNALGSGGKFLNGIYQTVRHPIDTVSNLADVGAGAVNQGLVATGLSKESDLSPEAASALAKTRAVEDAYKQRYGGMSKIANTAYTDPVGLLSDVSAFAGGTGAALKAGGMAKAANIASKVGEVANPLRVVSAPATRVAGGLLGGTVAERLYQSALKPSNKLPAATKAELIDTGLSEKIPVSGAGREKLGDSMDGVNQQIRQTIASGAQAGDTIDPNAVARRADDARSKFSLQVNPTADLNAIDNSKLDFLNGPGAGPIPVDLAQQIKQGTYQQLRKSYGQLSGAQIEAQKGLARGIKEELAAKYPELADLNARDSRLIQLNDALEKATGRIGNHQIFGIGTPLAAAGAHAVTGSNPVTAAVTAGRAIIDNPAIKSNIAIALRRAKVAPGAKSYYPDILNIASKVNGGLLY